MSIEQTARLMRLTYFFALRLIGARLAFLAAGFRECLHGREVSDSSSSVRGLSSWMAATGVKACLRFRESIGGSGVGECVSTGGAGGAEDAEDVEDAGGAGGA